MCARRLLRGEHSEIFLAGGRRCNVCELCAPRATHEGWLREVEHDPLDRAPLRPRRARSLLGRLRKAPHLDDRPTTSGQGEPYDFLDAAASDATHAPARERLHLEREDDPVRARGAVAAPVATQPAVWLQRAIDIFNAGEYPRRLAGVARSLGVPEVSIQPADGSTTRVGIVVAWELCWYRYLVEMRDDGGEARALAQGTTLDELTREERQANGSIDERGALSLLPA